MHSWMDEHLTQVGLSVVGSIAAFLASENHGWFMGLAYLVCGCFLGYLTMLYCIYNHVDQDLAGIYCGGAATVGREALRLVQKVVIERMNKIFMGIFK